MLTLQNITKSYNKNNAVLKNINLHIEKGDMVFIIGLSGAGKTTLMKLITREEKPTQGDIFIFDEKINTRKNIEEYKPHVYRRKIGIVFQDFKLLNDKTVFENIAYPLEVLGESKSYIKNKVLEVMHLTKIEEYANKLPSELSGGEKQRVAISRALVNNPDILLADEPTGNLDILTTDEIMSVLSNINKSGTTVIMVTHDTKALTRLSGRIIELDSGEIVVDTRK